MMFARGKLLLTALLLHHRARASDSNCTDPSSPLVLDHSISDLLALCHSNDPSDQILVDDLKSSIIDFCGNQIGQDVSANNAFYGQIDSECRAYGNTSSAGGVGLVDYIMKGPTCKCPSNFTSIVPATPKTNGCAMELEVASTSERSPKFNPIWLNETTCMLGLGFVLDSCVGNVTINGTANYRSFSGGSLFLAQNDAAIRFELNAHDYPKLRSVVP